MAVGEETPKQIQAKGTYSIQYAEEGNLVKALDWCWLKKGRWALSCQEDRLWSLEREDPEVIRSVLLEHFWLGDWKDEFPFERIVTMSPRALAMERRKKEAREPRFLLPVEMKSETAGYMVNAEDHPD